MCLNPVKIRNPREFVRPELDGQFIYVPCGHCEECRNQLINDWFVRLQYEKRSVESKGGCVYFLTLTYNDRFLPRVCTEDFNELCDEFKIDAPFFDGMCFNKRHVVQFFKDLRDLIREKYGVSGIKHFTVCEFGKDADGTHRPHYHTLIFSPVSFDPSIIRSLANYCWSARVKYALVPEQIKEQSLLPAVTENVKRGNYCVLQYWIVAPPVSSRHKSFLFKARYGFTSWSKDGAVVKTDGCLKYVLKYLFKDIEFCNTSVCNGLDFILEHCPSLEELENRFPPVDAFGCVDLNYKNSLENGVELNTNPDFIKYHKLIQSVRDKMPFHLQSQKLGDLLFQDIVSDWDNGKKLLEDNKITFSSSSDAFVYSVPRYIIRRLFYDVGQKKQNRHYAKYSNYVYLNEIGKECLCDFINTKIDYFVKQFRLYTCNMYVSMIDKNVIYNWQDKYGISFNQSLCRLRDMSDNEVKALFYYVHVFRGLPALYNQESLLNFSVDDLLAFGHDMFISKVKTSDMRELSDKYYNMLPLKLFVDIDSKNISVPPSECSGVLIFDDFPLFFGYNRLFDWLNSIRLGVKIYKCESKREKYDRIKVLRSLYNRFIYKT